MMTYLPPPSLLHLYDRYAYYRASKASQGKANVATIHVTRYTATSVTVVLIVSTGVRPQQAETYPVRSNTNAV